MSPDSTATFAGIAVLSAMRWAENYPLFILGLLSFATASFGRAAQRRMILMKNKKVWVSYGRPGKGGTVLKND